MTISLDNIFPLIVPASYYAKGTWDLPHYNLPTESFILTWVIFGSAATMSYLTRDQYQDLTNKHDDWQQKSFENLRHSIAENENFFLNLKWAQVDNCFLFLL